MNFCNLIPIDNFPTIFLEQILPEFMPRYLILPPMITLSFVVVYPVVNNPGPALGNHRRATCRTLPAALAKRFAAFIIYQCILADLARTTVRQTITAPLAGALQSAFAGGGLFGLSHEGGIAGERAPAVRYANAAAFEQAPRYHRVGFAGSGILPDEVPIIARRGELVVPASRRSRA